MKTPRTRPGRCVPLLIALTCIGCSEEEPAVKVVISGHPHTYADTHLRGDETISLTYLDEPFARSSVKAMRVKWEIRAGDAWRIISTSPTFPARLLKPGAYRLHVTVLKNGSFFDSGWRPVRVPQPPAPSASRPSTTPAVAPEADSSDSLPASAGEAPPAAPESSPPVSGSARGLSGALGR